MQNRVYYFLSSSKRSPLTMIGIMQLIFQEKNNNNLPVTRKPKFEKHEIPTQPCCIFIKLSSKN